MKYPTAHWAETAPDQKVLFEGPVAITHAGLEKQIVEAAGKLQTLGVAPGGRVALLSANSAEWIIIAHAVTRIGAILIPLNTRLTEREILELLEFYTPDVLIADTSSTLAAHTESRWAERTVRLGPPSDPACRWWNTMNPAAHKISTEVDPQRICTIISTSGTTGNPKGVCLSLSNHLAAAEASGCNLRNDPSDRWLINLPLFHIGGLSIIYRSAVSGLAMVVHDRFGVQEAIAAMKDSGVTHMSVVENMLTRLLDAWGERPFPATLRGVLAGGGHVGLDVLRRARRLGMPVLPTYGLTESASQVATLSPEAGEDLLATVGQPLPGSEVEVRDENNSPVPAGDQGQLWIRGPMVMRGYWTSSVAEPVPPADGWCPTGDIGVMDERGYLTIQGRVDDMIVSGGEKFFPAEIEASLGCIPGVQAVVVVAAEDSEWGQAPVAFLELIPGHSLTDTEIANALKGRLAGYKIPRKYIRMSAFPRTASGKTDRHRLIKEYRNRPSATEF